MSLSQTINYDTPGNFSYDASKIEVDASDNNKARLKLVPNPGQIFSQDFASSSGFTFDATKVEFVGGLVQQKVYRAGGTGTFFAPFTSSLNAFWSSGVAAGTAVGTGAISGGVLLGNSASPKGARWAGAGNVASAQVGTVRLTVYPQYTGNPGSNRIFFLMRQSTVSLLSSFHIYQAANGTLTCDIYNAAGTLGLSIAAAYSFTSGNAYEIEVNYDLTAGATRMFVNGVQHGSTSTATFSRTLSHIVDVILGSNFSDTFGGNANYDNLMLFSAVQHTANYTPAAPLETMYAAAVVSLPAFAYTGVGTILAVESSAMIEGGVPRYIVGGKYWNGSAWANSNGSYAQANTSADAIAHLPSLAVTGATSVVAQVIFTDSDTQSSVSNLAVTVTGQIYPTDDPSIEAASGVNADGLDGFAAVTGGTGGVRFQLRLSGNLYYWNGSAWAASNGSYAQASSAADIQDNRQHSSLTSILGTGKILKLRALLHSDTGQAAPDLTSATIDYNFFAPTPDALAECIVYTFARDILGDVFAGAPELIVELEAVLFHGAYVLPPSVKTVAVDADGRWEISLVETETVERAYLFKVRYTNASGKLKTVTLGRAEVPADASVNLATLTFT